MLVDVGKRDRHMDLALSYGVDLKKEGIPFLTVLDASGKVLENRETGGFEVEADGKQAHDPKKLLAFLKEREAPAWKAEERLAGALARAREEKKLLFLRFGAPW